MDIGYTIYQGPQKVSSFTRSIQNIDQLIPSDPYLSSVSIEHTIKIFNQQQTPNPFHPSIYTTPSAENLPNCKQNCSYIHPNMISDSFPSIFLLLPQDRIFCGGMKNLFPHPPSPRLLPRQKAAKLIPL